MDAGDHSLMAKPLRVGFLGAGLIATFHSKMLRAAGDHVERAGVYDPDPERAKAFAAASGHHVCATEAEVLDGCDAVYICTWTSEHLQLVDAACQRGLAIFCEKPLATTLADAEEMQRMVEASGVMNQVGLILRRSPAFTVLREMVHDPNSGRIMTVIFRDDQFIPIRGTYQSTWRGDVDKAGAGTLIEHSIHDIDLLEWIVGPAASVSGRSASFHDIAGIEDLAVASIGYPDGAIATLTSVWHDIDARPSLRRLEVFCERAWFAVEGDWTGPITHTAASGQTRVIETEAIMAEALHITGEDPNPDLAFVRAVNADEPASPSFATAVRAHRVADAFYRSAAADGAPADV
ncbi:MAG: Gfo/Idh/MocA family protein [Acidimicrobiales bacterium]